MIPKNLKFLAQGKRAEVYTFEKNKKVFCVKIKRKDSKAVGRLENEARFLKILNKHGIGPKLVESGQDYIMYEFVKGKLFDINNSKNNLIKQILDQCFVMDQLKINKEEMHHPTKHIFVFGKKITMIDFERCHYSDKVHNVTQFFQYLSLNKKFEIDHELLKNYKENPTEETYKKLLKQLKTKEI